MNPPPTHRSLGDAILNRVANRFTRSLLKSPVHDLLSASITLITYVGPRSGAVRTIPVNYVRDGDRLEVTSLRRRRWWRSLRGGRAVSVLLAGVDREGTAEVLDLEPGGERVVIEIHLGPEPALATSLRGTALWRRWTLWTTLGEVAGFAIPSLTWAVLAAAGVPELAAAPLIALAGAGEGAVLGLAQAAALRSALPGLPTSGWVRATALGAVLAWAAALVPTVLLAGVPAAAIATAVPAAAVVLLSMGILQRFVLRRHLSTARPWVAATAGAWLLGLTVFMAIATPLWHEGQSTAVTLAIGLAAGLLMAFTVACALGAVLTRLVTEAVRQRSVGAG